MSLKTSDLFWTLLRKLTPNGCQTLSKAPSRFIDGVYPKVLDYGKDGHVYDVDGTIFVDLISGLGAVSVGYANKDVNDAVKKQLDLGVSFSLPTMLEYHVAQKLTELVPGTDMWKFTKTGSDATTMAVKCARAYTKRDNVLVCGYHGWHDWYSIVNEKRAGIPTKMSDYVARAKYNDISSFNTLRHRHYAAVIIEPMVFEQPLPTFFKELRELCDETGTLLIFDEVVTGGRMSGFVAQNLFDVKPDLTVLSKGIANGFPLAAVGGREEVMHVFEREDFFASTTFGGEAVSLIACFKTLEILEKEIPAMVMKGQRIQDCFNTLFEGIGVAKGYPTRLTFDFTTKEQKALFMQEMCLNQVLIGYSNFIMASHTDFDVDYICAGMIKAARVLRKHYKNPTEALKGAMPIEVFRMRQ